MDILEVNDNFTLIEEVNGPLLAVFYGIEFILSIVANLFVLIFTLCHPTTLKQPSIIFLTNFIFANLLVTVLIMPLSIVAAANEEWIFGRTPEEKNGSCQFAGFMFAFGIQLTIFTLTVISVDRFLFIVKPFIYKQFVKPWVAVIVVFAVWILACLVNLPPYFGLGEYAFGQYTATCVQVWVGQRYFLAYFCLIMFIVATTIIVTTLWTFCFTRNFIKRTYHYKSGVTGATKKANGNDSLQKHLYMSQVRKLIGIFGILIMITIVTFVPAVIAGIVGIIIGSENLPTPIFAIVVISFYSVANPIIQSYFRRDLKEFIIHVIKKMTKCHCAKEEKKPAMISITSTSVTSMYQSNFNTNAD